MGKRPNFSEQILRFSKIVLWVFCFSTWILFVVLYAMRIINLKGLIIVTAAQIFVFAIFFVTLYVYIQAPYEKACQKYKRFAKGLIYDDLFCGEYEIFPYMQEMLQRFNDMLDRQTAIKISTKQAEYLALQNQINPHFLYNTLEAIRGEALSNGAGEIADITQALAKFFRYTITDTGSMVTLEDELDNVETYFQIQEYRFGEKIKMRIEIPTEDKDVYRLQLPKLTLQPIIENAISHGLEQKAGTGLITINSRLTKNKFIIEIHDNGIGIKEDELEKINRKLEKVSVSYVNEREGERGGIALKNVCRRIKLLFGEEYGLSIYSLYGVGTNVQIVIPQVKSGEDI